MAREKAGAEKRNGFEQVTNVYFASFVTGAQGCFSNARGYLAWQSMSEKTNVTVVESGYVGMPLADLLAQHSDVTVLDIDPDRVDEVNHRESTVADADIEAFLKKELSLSAMLNADEAHPGADFVMVA